MKVRIFTFYKFHSLTSTQVQTLEPQIYILAEKFQARGLVIFGTEGVNAYTSDDETVYMGDTITAESRLLSLDEKDGGSGPFVLTTRQTTFTNQDGRVVARTRQVGISR